MKLVEWAAVSALVVAGPVDGPRIEPGFEAGWVFEMTAETTQEVRCDDVSVRVNGNEIPIEGIPDLAAMRDTVISSQNERLVMRDEVESVASGRPTSVRRSFVELEREKESPDDTETLTGALEGMSIRVRAGEDDDEARSVTLLDDEDVEAGFLDGHKLVIHSFFNVELEEGESSTMDVGDMRSIDSGPEYFELGGDDDDDDDEGLDEFLETLFADGVTLTWERTVAQDGMNCAELIGRLEAELDVAEAMASRFGELAGNGVIDVPGSFEIELTALVDVATARTVAFEMTADGQFVVEIEREIQEGVTMEMRLEMSMSQTLEVAWDYEP